MITRTQKAAKFMLAVWLAFSFVAAGALVHLRELHAKLHCEGSSPCCASSCETSHKHADETESELPQDHQCLIELIAAGCVDGPVAIGFVPIEFTAISETPLVERNLFVTGISSSAIPGRAPPSC